MATVKIHTTLCNSQIAALATNQLAECERETNTVTNILACH